MRPMVHSSIHRSIDYADSQAETKKQQQALSSEGHSLMRIGTRLKPFIQRSIDRLEGANLLRLHYQS